VRGKLTGSENLKRTIKKAVTEHQRKEKIFLFNDKVFLKGKKKSVEKAKGKKTNSDHAATLAPYVKQPFTIRMNYKGKIYKAKVRRDGTIFHQGVIYYSPSVAGARIRKKKNLNGWKSWMYKSKSGDWVYLDELRK
jgi:hypothetical protein